MKYQLKCLFCVLAVSAGLFVSCQKDDDDEVERIESRGSKVIVISDIHLNDNRSEQLGYSWIGNSGKAELAAFLDSLAGDMGVGTLVVDGDMFDEWVAPVDLPPYVNLSGRSTDSEADYFKVLVRDNNVVVDAFRRLKNAGVELVYVPGNHDMAITSSDFSRELGDLFIQARDAEGLGSFTPRGMAEVVIEHGHRYDFNNAPDPNPATGSMLPIGFAISKYACGVDLAARRSGQAYASENGFSFEGLIDTENEYNNYLWDSIIAARGLEDSLDAVSLMDFGTYYSDVIADLIAYLMGGFSGEGDEFNYMCFQAAWAVVLMNKHYPDERSNIEALLSTINMTFPYGPQVFLRLIPLNERFLSLYDGLWKQRHWIERCSINNVAVPISFDQAVLAGGLDDILDGMSKKQYFDNPQSNKRIVVFGHTHKAMVRSETNSTGQQCIYANTGTWVDAFYAGKDNPSHTFIEIDRSDNVYTITLRQFHSSATYKTMTLTL